MFKEKLKKLPSKIFYILFALIVAIALWLYVEITEEAEQSHNVSNIPIVFRNEDTLRDRGWIPRVLTQNLSLTFVGARADIFQLAAPGAVSVEVNLADVTTTGVVQLDYRVLMPPAVNPNAIEIPMRSVGLITLLIDQVLEREIPVVANYTGGTASTDLVHLPVVLEPRFVVVRGPEEAVSRINHVYVPIFRENLSGTITEDMEFILIDEYGEQLDDDLLETLAFNHYTIRVTIPIREMMDVPLTAALLHGSTTSELNIRVVINPSHVTVSAEPDRIRELNTFMLGTVNMTAFSTSTTIEFPILVPDGIENISGETAATVYVEVLGLNTDILSTPNLHVINTPAGLTANIVNQTVTVTLRGLAEDLALVSPENIRVVADVGELGLGTSTLLARIYLDGIDAPIDPIGGVNLTVRIAEAEIDEP